ncbi:MAG: AAA family ATPase, partial [Anaerolineae bacterium]|nr:AAA family ATPase [Anaerolineae bacterium]
APDDTLAGTLAYISPEQTGRMNRPVDYRTDLYSLGVTLYELFTGQLPFQASDALEMIHSHIARLPTPPAEVNSDVPPPISDIILKLLAKNAEDRYQTAHALQADLRHCLDQYQAAGQIEPFELGRDDFSGRLQIPAKLYGREAEITQLLETFGRVTEGRAELLLVIGYAGVGKTSLVHEIQRPITEKRGYFIEGKFDQYQRSIPYSAWGQAFARLVDLWLTESQASIDARNAIILEAVGQNGQVLIDLFPNLEHIIGPQPAVPDQGGQEAQNRFSYFFQRFIRAVARPDQPLVVFLDDLQWIDLASLKLFDILLSDPDSKHFLVIGAYRDNEVEASHPLMVEVSRLKEAGCPVDQLGLDNLNLEQVNALVSDSLRMPADSCLPLARLIQAKTEGNAFFARQLLDSLAVDGLLTFDNNEHYWQWDITQMNEQAIAENVVELMVNKMRRLPAASQEMLQIAACLGTQFDLSLLHLVSEKSQEETRLALQAAYEEGFIVRVNGSGSFAHDRIQQAAYSLIPGHEKPGLHRHIGRMLLAESTVQAQAEHLFEIVGHLNMGVALIETADERHELAELNTKAAESALRATAYAAASANARTGIRLLGDDGWQSHYQLRLNLHLLAAEAAYLNADYDLSEQHIETILTSARSEVDRASAYVIRIDSYNSQHQLQRAIDTGLRALRELGVTLQEVPPAELTLEVLRDLPVMSDRREQAATQILAACFHPIYVGRPELLPTIVLTALHLTITHGLTPAGCLAIVSYAAVFVWPDDIEAAYQFGQLGLQLIERLDDKRYLCQVKAIFDVFLYHWKEPFLKVKSAIQQGIQIGFETGNNNYQGTNLITDTMLNALVGQPLPQAQAEMERNLQQLEQVRERYRSYDAYLWTQYVAHLRGMAAEPTQFAGPYFVEETDLPAAKADHIHNTILQFHTLKSMLHFHLGDYRAAYAHARQAEPLVPPAAGSLNIHLVPFYQSLALCQFSERQTEHVKKLDENVGQLRLWAAHAPVNYQHKLDIVLAERERVAGNAGTALDHYEQAIAGAKQNKFLQDEALANELYGRFWHERGNDNIAQLYLREAHALYRRWGAGAITAHLEAQYPQWLTVGTIDVSRLGVEVSIAETQSNLDVRSVLKTAEAIAGELDLKKLLQTTIKIMMENAGAQQSFLIVERDGQWLIEAAGEVDTDEVRVLQGINIEDSEQVSAGIVRYVAHTQQMVLLADAASAGQFRQDPIIQRRQVKSVLVVPLINRGQLSGILYLENNLASHAFTPERVELLKLLSSQMAISIDHAWLYDHLEEVVAERTQALSFAEEQIRALFESSQVGISLTTLAGQVLAANKALMLMTGYSERELLQRNVIEFYVDPEQRHELLERLAASEAVHNFGVKFKRKDSSPFFANMNVSQAKRGGQEVLIAMIEDVTEQVQLNEQLQQEITERKQAEQELQTQITLVDGLLDAAAESVEIWDAQTLEYIKWNKTFRQLTGYSDDEIA